MERVTGEQRDGVVGLTPLALWALREQLRLDGIEIPVLAAASARMTLAAGQPRLAAVNLVRRLGAEAHLAWRDAMQRPELRGYARIALSMLAADLPESTMPLVLNPAPDDLTWVATDLLTLACGDDDPDPQQIAEQFSEAVPQGEEAWIFGLMSQSSHPDVTQVLTVLGRSHPDRRVAREARRAARVAAKNRTVARDGRVPARTAAR